MTIYPAQIDNNQSLPPAVDNLTPVTGAVFNNLRTALITIETELGVKPSGVYGTVKSRLDTLENIIGNLQIIQLSGDLGGSLTNPLVIGLYGRPLSSTTPITGQVIAWNGIAWVPTTTNAVINFSGDLSGNGTSQTVVGLQGLPITTNTPTMGQGLIFDGYHWTPGAVGGAGPAGGDLGGTYPNPSVISIHGSSVPAGGSLVTGNVLQVTGPSLLNYGPVNLANSNSVTGVLPAGNQASQTMSGDVTGTTAASTVAALQHFAVDTLAPNALNVLTWNATVNKWQPQPNSASVIPRPSWTQATWFIDPQNVSTNASDTNSGLDALHPVRTWAGGVLAKLGTYSPILGQDTTFTFISSHTDNTDAVIFRPIIDNGAKVIIMGALTAPLVNAGVLSGVTAKNPGVNGSGNLLQANLSFAASAGQLIVNTTLSNARCLVYRNVSGTTFNLSQPFQSFLPSSPAVGLGVAPVEENGFNNGHIFNLYNLISVSVAEFSPVVKNFGASFTGMGCLYQMNILDNTGNDLILGDNSMVIDSVINRFLVCYRSSFNIIVNTSISAADILNTFELVDVNLTFPIYGGFVNLYSTLNGVALLSNFIIGAPDISVIDGAIGEVFIDNNTGNNTLFCYGQTDGYNALVYGPSTLDIPSGKFKIPITAASATNAFKQGSLFLGIDPINFSPANQTASAYDASPGPSSPAVWYAGRALGNGSGAGANIDVPISSGGFGGLAISPVGACIVKNGSRF